MSDYCCCGAIYLPPPVDYATIDNYEHTRSQCSDLITNDVFSAPTGECR